jgi:hypothetical protein
MTSRAAALLATISALFAIGAGSSTPIASPHPQPPSTYLVFDGISSRVDVPASADFSVGPDGMTVAVWMRPDAVTFAKTEGSLADEQYVHWLGKGRPFRQEWTFRMYSLTQPGPRANRVSFYVFNPIGGRGCGSYFQDPIVVGQWMLVTGVVDPDTREIAIYKNGVPRHRDSYASLSTGPVPGEAPLGIGSKNLSSYFRGAIGPVWIWDRVLSEEEIHDLFASGVVPKDDLELALPMDEGAGTVVHDAVGSDDGTIAGATWGHGAGPIATGTGTSGGGC